MAHGGRLFLQPIKMSLAAITSPSSQLSCSRIASLKTWIKVLEPAVLNRAPISHWRSCLRRLSMNNFSSSGNKLGMGCIFGASVGLGSLCLRPRIIHAIDGFDISAYDNDLGLTYALDDGEDPHHFLAFARKLLLPVCLIVTMLMNWDHPIILATKIILILIGTKPSPLSVYLFIEQLRRKIMHQRPFVYKFKSLYAKKVDVEDYIFLCLAKVEIKDQKFTLIGILGSWWALPQESFYVVLCT
ncbi:hypothetical protein NMG60_11006683 [Bertholletia excelsa]